MGAGTVSWWVWRLTSGKREEKPAKDPGYRSKDPQVTLAREDDGLWLDGPPEGSPEWKAFQRWMQGVED